MTNEEAIMLLNPITKALALAEIEYYNGFRGKDAYIKAKEDACILAVEALKKANKYRWHDSDYVLVMIGTPEWNDCEWAYYHHDKKLWSTYGQNVFAWRYVEPFEEEE